MELYTEILQIGHYCLNDEIKTISILKQNWDFYYEEGYDDDTPDLDKEGYAYYAIYGEYDNLLYANRSQTCTSLEAVISLVETVIYSKIKWNKMTPN